MRAASLVLFLTVTLTLNVRAAEDRTLLLALGDSTTAGTPYFRSPIEKPPFGSGDPKGSYAYWIMLLRPEWTVLNHGVNAERTDQILRRFENKEIPPGTDTVIVLAGVNDLHQGRSSEDTAQGLKAIYDSAIRRGCKVLACTVLPYDRSTADVRQRMQKLNLWIRSYAEEQGLGYCDTYTAAVDPLRPGMLKGSPDGYHPNVNTARLVGEAVLQALERTGV